MLTRLFRALRYLRNPGGRTHRHVAMRRTVEQTTDMLRRELARTRTIDRVAHLAVAEALALPTPHKEKRG